MNEDKGILFDMDGVLVDSEHALRECCIKKMRDYGVEAKHEDFIEFTGMGEDAFVGGVVRKHGVEYCPAMKDEIYDVYDSEGRANIVVAPGVRETVEQLKKRFKIAVASAADRRKVEINLSVVGFTSDFFDAVITGSEVTKKKPDPEIYLAAAKAVGIDPQKCTVVEDAVSGVRAAKAAGCRCIAVAGSFSKEDLLAAGADDYVQNTADILGLL